MSIGLLFWIVYLVWVILGVYNNRVNQALIGYHVVIAVLLFLVGWRLFGFPIHA